MHRTFACRPPSRTSGETVTWLIRAFEYGAARNRLRACSPGENNALERTFPVYDPGTGEEMDQCAAGDKADIDLAVKAARRAFARGLWSRLTHGQRGKLIWKLADLIEEHLEEFAQIESIDNGKPLSVARVADVPLAVDLFRYMAGWTTKIEGQTLSTSELRVLHWHGDTFDLPGGATHLAGTAHYANQGFVVGNYALALQFHLEVTVHGLERWYVGHACELAQAGICVRQLREESRTFGPELETVAGRVWRHWLEHVSNPTQNAAGEISR
jgi:hypothetical protein